MDIPVRPGLAQHGRTEMSILPALRNGMIRLVCSLPLVCVLATITASDEPAATGTISGTVRYSGDVPPARKILLSDGVTLLHNDLVVDGPTKGLRYVILHLEKSPEKVPLKKEKPARTAVVDQRDMIFLPRVLAIQEGQKVRFDNNDLCNHGVQAISSHQGNTFNVNTPMGQPFHFDFSAQKTPVMIGCPIHAWMRAWIAVFPHPYFAVTDAKGSFKLNQVPVGKHTLLIFHPDSGMKEKRTMEVAGGKSTQVQIEWSKTAGLPRGEYPDNEL